MKTKLSVRGFSGLLVILTFTTVAIGVSLPSLRAQAPTAGAPPAPPPTAASMKGKTAGQVYINLKVLQDIPADELRPAMEYITVALGVGCNECHTSGKFDSDDRKEKNVARSMMAMTFALNSTVFDGKRELTCYTCHRGESRPSVTPLFPGETSPRGRTAAEIFPPLAVRDITNLDSGMSPSKAPATVGGGQPGGQRPAGAAPAALPAVADVFSKYTQALGGMDAIGKVTSLVEKGTAEMLVPAPPPPPGTRPTLPALGSVPAEIDRKLPGKAVVSIQFPGRAPNLEGFDGTVGWIGARENTGGALALSREFAQFPPALKFAEDHTKVQVDAMEKIGDRDVYRVVGTRTDGSALDRLYFDARTGLLVRSYTTLQTVLGSLPEETNYDDYRVVGGLNVPYTVTVLAMDGNRTYKWSQVNVNASVEDSKFAMPSPPPPPPQQLRPAVN